MISRLDTTTLLVARPTTDFADKKLCSTSFRTKPNSLMLFTAQTVVESPVQFFTANTKQSSIFYITHYPEFSWFNIPLKTNGFNASSSTEISNI